MHQNDGHVVDVSQVVELRGEVDVAGDQDHRGGGGVGVSETSQALTEFVVCGIFGDRIDMDQRHLI